MALVTWTYGWVAPWTLIVAACAGESNRAAESDEDPSQGVASDDAEAATGAYPTGPYGEDNPDLDEVVENLEFRGLFNQQPPMASAALAVEPLDWQRFRQTDARYLLIITAMAWCGSCRQGANELGLELEPRVTELQARGGLATQLLLQGAGSAPPTDEELTSWATAGDLAVSVLGPATDRAAVVFPQREWGFIVRLDTMQVVWRTQVALYAEPTAGLQGIDELERRLAQ